MPWGGVPVGVRIRGLATTAWVAVAIAALGTGCASRAVEARGSGFPLSPGPTSSSASNGAVDLTDTVPWIDAPTVPPAPSEPPSPPPRPTDARPCQPGDLTARLQPGGAAMGTEFTLVRFHNASDSTCALKGDPEVTATEPGLPDVAADHEDFPDTSTANMAPGQDTWLALPWTVNCLAGSGGGGGGGPPYHHIQITLPGGGTIVVDDTTGLDLTCGLRSGHFYVPEPPPPHPPLRALLQTPDSVAAGSTLVYVVVLTNTSDESISLNPCPVYEQVAATPHEDVETLNCKPVDTIAAHQTLRFEMHLPIAADAPREPAKLWWGLAWPDDLAISTATLINIQ
jgi:hypothetical protein